MFLALSVGWFELCVCIHYYYYFFFFYLLVCLGLLWDWSPYFLVYLVKSKLLT